MHVHEHARHLLCAGYVALTLTTLWMLHVAPPQSWASSVAPPRLGSGALAPIDPRPEPEIVVEHNVLSSYGLLTASSFTFDVQDTRVNGDNATLSTYGATAYGNEIDHSLPGTAHGAATGIQGVCS